MGTAPSNKELEEVQRFSRFCNAFLASGSEINIGAIQGVCEYSIERSGVRLKILNPTLEEQFMKAVRRFRKPGTLTRKMEDDKIIITFSIRRD